MKKNIEVVSAGTPLFEWLKGMLDSVPSDIGDITDLQTALRNISDGISSTLILELDDTGEASSGGNRIQCGDLSIYVNARRVTRGGEDIYLTPKEFDILCFLAGNRGEVFTKEQIYQAVWDNDYLLDSSNIMAFIRKLRKKIEPDPDKPVYILTIWGIGYKFNDRI